MEVQCWCTGGAFTADQTIGKEQLQWSQKGDTTQKLFEKGLHGMNVTRNGHWYMGANWPLDSPRRYWLINSCAGLRFGICGGCRARADWNGNCKSGVQWWGSKNSQMLIVIIFFLFFFTLVFEISFSIVASSKSSVNTESLIVEFFVLLELKNSSYSA